MVSTGGVEITEVETIGTCMVGSISMIEDTVAKGSASTGTLPMSDTSVPGHYGQHHHVAVY